MIQKINPGVRVEQHTHWTINKYYFSGYVVKLIQACFMLPKYGKSYNNIIVGYKWNKMQFIWWRQDQY